MEELIKTLRKEFKSYGHFKISIIKDGKPLSVVTTNTMAIDCAFDEYYDDEDRSGCYYESRLEGQEALVNEILNSHDLEI